MTLAVDNACGLRGLDPKRPARFFSWSEVFTPRYPLTVPTGAELDKLLLNAIRLGVVLDALRELADRPLQVTSWYRDAEVNARVGGVPNSHHLDGTGADLLVKEDDIVVAFAKAFRARRLLAEALWHKGHLHVAVPRL